MRRDEPGVDVSGCAAPGTRGQAPRTIADAISEFGAEAKKDLPELYRRMVFNILAGNVDDHLRNHAFLWRGTQGWSLSPAYDLNPTPTDIRPRMLTTAIVDEERACDLDLAIEAAEYFGLNAAMARQVTKEVAAVTRGWRSAAVCIGAPGDEIDRMSGAFEHEDLQRALRL